MTELPQNTQIFLPPEIIEELKNTKGYVFISVVYDKINYENKYYLNGKFIPNKK